MTQLCKRGPAGRSKRPQKGVDMSEAAAPQMCCACKAGCPSSCSRVIREYSSNMVAPLSALFGLDKQTREPLRIAACSRASLCSTRTRRWAAALDARACLSLFLGGALAVGLGITTRPGRGQSHCSGNCVDPSHQHAHTAVEAGLRAQGSCTRWMCGTWTRCLEKGNGNPVRKKVRSPTTSECRFGLNLPPVCDTWDPRPW